MIVIPVVNQKGGCGKTTTAVNLSYALALEGHKVLLVDFDPQANATYSLGITPKSTITDLLEHTIANTDYNLQEVLINNRTENMDVIPSSIGLSAIEQMLSTYENKLHILKHTFSRYPMNYDYCIIDCPPNLGILTLNALMVSDYAIVPLEVCGLSLEGVNNLKEVLGMLFSFQKKIPVVFYLITKYDKRFKFSDTFLTKIKDHLNGGILSTVIRTNISLREAESKGKSIFEYKKEARGAKDYRNLAKEVESITQKNTYTQFVFKCAECKEVYLVGEFNNWEKNEKYKLHQLNHDTWIITLPLRKGKYQYKFLVDGKWVNDPTNDMLEDDAFGGKNSVVLVG